jgi:hypothetical protein
MENVKIKVGDTVVCLPGFSSKSNGRGVDDLKYGGSGYVLGKVFVVQKVDFDVLWPDEQLGGGVFLRAVALVNKDSVGIMLAEQQIKKEIYGK